MSKQFPVDIQTLAALFSVTEKAVRDWIAAGLPTLKRGQPGRGRKTSIDLAAAVRWFFAERRNELDLQYERARLAKAQADKTEIENEVRAGKLKPLDAVVREVGEMLSGCQRRLVQVPGTVAQVLDPATASKVEPLVRRVLFEAMSEIAEGGWRNAKS